MAIAKYRKAVEKIIIPFSKWKDVRANGGVNYVAGPIVQDVRKAGEELVKQANYNLHTFFQNLGNNEKKQKRNSENLF